jgi:hypothetical protein
LIIKILKGTQAREFLILTPQTEVTPTTAMMSATAVTPATAHEFCGDSQKISKTAKTHSTFTKYKLSLILNLKIFLKMTQNIFLFKKL